MSYDFTAAQSGTTITPPSALQDGVPTRVWSSDPITQGSHLKAVSVIARYEAVSAATAGVSPFDFGAIRCA